MSRRELKRRLVLNALERLGVAQRYCAHLLSPGPMSPERAASRAGVSRATADRLLKQLMSVLAPGAGDVTGSFILRMAHDAQKAMNPDVTPGPAASAEPSSNSR